MIERFDHRQTGGLGQDAALMVLAMGSLLWIGPLTLAVAGTGNPEANTFFTAWYATVVGVLIPLAAAGVAIGFIARAVSNAQDGSSPVGAVVGALVTAGGAMLLPSIAVIGTAGSEFSLLEVPRGASSLEPFVFYAYLLIRLAKDKCSYGRAT